MVDFCRPANNFFFVAVAAVGIANILVFFWWRCLPRKFRGIAGIDWLRRII